MNRLSILACGLALGLALPAMAQVQDKNAGAEPAEEISTEARISFGGNDADLKEFNAALQALASADVVAITPDTEIEVIQLSAQSDEADKNSDDYTTTVPSDPQDVGELRSLLEGNSVIASVIEGAGYSVDQVANLWVQGDGTLTIFVDE